MVNFSHSYRLKTMEEYLINNNGLNTNQLENALAKLLCGSKVKSFDVVSADKLQKAISSGRFPRAVISNIDDETKPGV